MQTRHVRLRCSRFAFCTKHSLTKLASFSSDMAFHTRVLIVCSLFAIAFAHGTPDPAKQAAQKAKHEMSKKYQSTYATLCAGTFDVMKQAADECAKELNMVGGVSLTFSIQTLLSYRTARKLKSAGLRSPNQGSQRHLKLPKSQPPAPHPRPKSQLQPQPRRRSPSWTTRETRAAQKVEPPRRRAGRTSGVTTIR